MDNDLIALGHLLCWTTDTPFHRLIPKPKQEEALLAALTETAGGQLPPVQAQVTTQDGVSRVRVAGVLGRSLWAGGVDIRQIIRDLDQARPERIELLIESPGGIMADGQALASDLQARQRQGTPVAAEARGMVGSSATMPFLACDTRIMGEHSNMMIHAPLYGLLLMRLNKFNIDSEVEKAKRPLTAATDIMVRLYVERTGQTQEQIEGWLKAGDKYMTAQEAAELGFATGRIEAGRTIEAVIGTASPQTGDWMGDMMVRGIFDQHASP